MQINRAAYHRGFNACLERIQSGAQRAFAFEACESWLAGWQAAEAQMKRASAAYRAQCREARYGR